VLGIIGPNRVAMGNALIMPDNGLLVLMPWVLLAVAGAIVVALRAERRARVGAEALVCAIVAVAYVVFVGSLVPEFGRAGWAVGPRYIGVAMPFFAWLAVAGFAWADRRPATRALAGATLLVGVIVYVATATTYPHWPTPAFRNPVHEVAFRTLREGLAPPSLGGWLGLPGPWALAPVYVTAAALCAWALGVRPGRRAASTVAATIFAIAIVWGYGAFPRGASPERPWTYVRGTITAR
jgi:hypothetical protein